MYSPDKTPLVVKFFKVMFSPHLCKAQVRRMTPLLFNNRTRTIMVIQRKITNQQQQEESLKKTLIASQSTNFSSTPEFWNLNLELLETLINTTLSLVNLCTSDYGAANEVARGFGRDVSSPNVS